MKAKLLPILVVTIAAMLVACDGGKGKTLRASRIR